MAARRLSVAHRMGRGRTFNCHAAGSWLSPAPPRVAGHARRPFLARRVCGVWAFLPLEVSKGQDAALVDSARITGKPEAIPTVLSDQYRETRL